MAYSTMKTGLNIFKKQKTKITEGISVTKAAKTQGAEEENGNALMWAPY